MNTSFDQLNVSHELSATGFDRINFQTKRIGQAKNYSCAWTDDPTRERQLQFSCTQMGHRQPSIVIGQAWETRRLRSKRLEERFDATLFPRTRRAGRCRTQGNYDQQIHRIKHIQHFMVNCSRGNQEVHRVSHSH